MPPPPLTLIHVGQVQPNPAWGMKAHAHAVNELIGVVRGRMSVTSGDRTIPAAAGDVLVYPAGATHAEAADPAQPAETLFVSFRGPNLGREVFRLEDARGRILQALRWLFEDRLSADPAQAAVRASLIAMVLAELVALRHSPRPGIVARAQSWVRSHLGESLSLAQLARQEGLSRFHFLRLYKAAAGQTPMHDVHRLRVAHARDLLMGTRMPLKEIALQSGLGSVHAMSRAFRREFGIPPGRLRQRG